MEPQMEEFCGAFMKMKVEDQVESPPERSTESDPVISSPGTQDSSKLA